MPRMDAVASQAAADLTGFKNRYLANLEALYGRDSELAQTIDALPFAALPSLEPTRDGHYTVRLPADDGAEIALHSRHRPIEEAAKLAASVADDVQPTFHVEGLGLGYLPAELERRFDRPVLLCVEDDPVQIKLCLCVQDFSGAIRDGRLRFLWKAERRFVYACLSPCNADVLLGLHRLALPHVQRRHVAFFDAMRGLLADYLAYARTQLTTLIKTSQITFKNVLFNLPYALRYPGVETLAGRAAGYPAIVVAAGPSLARNLAQLAPLRDRAVLIAVQTVFKLLQSLGLPPHFVTSLDYHEVSAEFFRGLEDVGGSVLVAEPKASWHVLDAFRGRMHVLHHKFADRMLGGLAPRRGGLRAGATVAHLAYYLAEHLGCDPIIFVGQDLAFTEGRFYLPGSPIERLWEPELGRFCTAEMKQWERIVRNRPILRPARDVAGNPVYCDDMLFTYAEQFQNEFAVAKQRIIQASEGGLALRGMQVMSLREAAERYCQRCLPDGLFRPEPLDARAAAPRQAAAELRARRGELEELRSIAVEMRGLLQRLCGLTSAADAFNRLIVQVDALRMRITRYEPLYQLVVEVSPQAELRRYAADRRLGAPQQETPAVAQRRLKRDCEFVDAFLDGLAFVAATLDQAAERLERFAP